MKKIIYLLFLALPFFSFAQDEEMSDERIQVVIDSIENTMNYQVGDIKLDDGNATIHIPKGFKFLNAKQSTTVLTDYWGNPPEQAEGVLGMVILEKNGVLADDSWAFILTYEDMGYVKDDDADDIDYDEMEDEMKKEEIESNKIRVEQGYEPIYFKGWAEKPYYDKEKKVLHWAKELKFGDDEDEQATLNYNLRILGRKGVFMFNAVSGIDKLDEVNKNMETIINSVTFEEGYTYADFNPEIDDVAKWTIGGLVAGKILAKVGFFAVILKFWKIIAVAIAGFFGFKKKRKEKKNNITFVNEEKTEEENDNV